jgi:uncharacterized protein YndB with AHSA1/START domain
MADKSFIAEPGKQEIVLTQLFPASRDLVFKLYTDPALIPQWWGSKRLTTTVDKMDVRAGGLWRFVQQDAQGEQYAFHGVYHEVARPARLVFTFEYEGEPGNVILETVVFMEQDRRTKLVDTSVFQTVEARDGMLKEGMEAGATESMDRLMALLPKNA